MEVLMCVIFLTIIACIIAIWFTSIYNKFQEYIIRINEAEADIDSTLRKRYDLLNKSIEVIKSVTEQETVLEVVTNLRSQKLNNFELDRMLYDCINEFNGLKEAHEDLKKTEGFIKIDIALNETEAEMVADRKYYNDIITDYNKMVKSIPSNVIAKLFKFSLYIYHNIIYFLIPYFQ